MRYLWLCQVSYAGRMIALGQCPIICVASTKPEHQVPRALQVLLTIIRSQIDQDVDHSNAHLVSSCTTWFQQRYCSTELPCEFCDPLETDEDDPIDPADETFPEQASPVPGVQVTDRLCMSRFEFLSDFKKLLYRLQDHGTTMETT